MAFKWFEDPNRSDPDYEFEHFGEWLDYQIEKIRFKIDMKYIRGDDLIEARKMIDFYLACHKTWRAFEED
jgi:hypothetical protein